MRAELGVGLFSVYVHAKVFVGCAKLGSGTLKVLGFHSDGVVVVRVLEFTGITGNPGCHLVMQSAYQVDKVVGTTEFGQGQSGFESVAPLDATSQLKVLVTN